MAKPAMYKRKHHGNGTVTVWLRDEKGNYLHLFGATPAVVEETVRIFILTHGPLPEAEFV